MAGVMTGTMLGAMLVEPGRIELQEIPIPRPGPGEVLVRIRTALTCGTDLKTYRRGHPKLPTPTRLGHEFSGDVAVVGDGVKAFREGDPIMSVHSAPCGTCHYCRRGLENLCEAIFDEMALGAFAEYLLVGERIVRQNMFPKPADLPYEEAALLEPLACVVHGIEQVPIQPRDTVTILGAGAIGLLHLLVLKARGVERVFVAGRHPLRLSLAQQLGADRVIDVDEDDVREVVASETRGLGCEHVIECCGTTDGWEQAVDLAARGASILLFGGCPGGSTATFDTTRLHYDQITLKGAFHFTPRAVCAAYRLLAEGVLRAGALISERYALEDLQYVFDRLDTGRGIKYAVEPRE